MSATSTPGQKPAEKLSGNWLDKTSVSLFALFSTVLAVGLAGRASDSPWVLGSSLLVGWILSDLVSGVVHWAGDTWGTAEWFWVGPHLIRPFREHHVDPKGITRHDFFDVNGNNCLICLPLLVGFAFVDFQAAGPALLFTVGVIWSLTFWTFATNQIHLWAHRDKNPAWIVRLQKLWIILPPDEHSIHHEAPYAKYYCITSGWLNPILARTGFFRGFEKAVTALTGAIPRSEDTVYNKPAGTSQG